MFECERKKCTLPTETPVQKHLSFEGQTGLLAQCLIFSYSSPTLTFGPPQHGRSNFM